MRPTPRRTQRPLPRTWRLAPVAAICLVWSVAGSTGCGGTSSGPPGAAIDVDRSIGGLGDTPGRFAYPRAIDVSADGRLLWVIDKSARVQRIDPETGRCRAIWRMPDSDLGKPVGFCIAPGQDQSGAWCDELLYIADTHYHRVMVYKPPPLPTAPDADLNPDEKPELVARFGEYGQGPGQFILPTDVAVQIGEDGRSVARIYVGEYGGNDRISVFDGTYRFLFSFGRWGLDSSATGGEAVDRSKILLARPQSLLLDKIDGRRELVVTDSANHRIGRFTLDGDLIAWIGSAGEMGAGPGQFRFPYGLASLGDGTVLVSEFGGNRVQRIRLSDGRSLGTWGHAGRGPGELASPWAVAALRKSVFVVDSGNNRLLGFARPR